MGDKNKLQKELTELEENMSKVDFWTNKAKAQATIRRITELKAEIAGVGKYDTGDAVMTIFSASSPPAPGKIVMTASPVSYLPTPAISAFNSVIRRIVACALALFVQKSTLDIFSYNSVSSFCNLFLSPIFYCPNMLDVCKSGANSFAGIDTTKTGKFITAPRQAGF